MKVSVIVPVYNAEKYICDCLDALQSQTLEDIEVICVDDGSTDASTRIIEEYAKRDIRFRAVHTENAGAGVARNIGMDWANGDYLAFCDPDDIPSKDQLKQLYTAAKKHDADIAVCRWTRFNGETGKSEPPFQFSGGVWKLLKAGKTCISPDELPEGVFVMAGYCPWCKLFRRKFVKDKALRFQALRRTNDMFFVASALANANKIALVDKSLHRYRVGIKSATTNDSLAASFCDALIALKKRLVADNLYEKFKRCFLPLVVTSFINNVSTCYGAAALHSLYPKMRSTVLELLREDGLGQWALVKDHMKDVWKALEKSDDPLEVMIILFQYMRKRDVAARSKLLALGSELDEAKREVRRIAALEDEVASFKSTTVYRTGMVVTWPARMIGRILQSFRHKR